MREMLRQKWFGGKEKEEAEALELAKSERAMWQAFVTEPGYRKFRDWIDAGIASQEINADDHSKMLQAIGIRKGMQLIRQQMRTIEEHSMEEIR